MTARKRIEVAAAVIENARGEFLLAQRPAGKVYAGYWEFPGGKVEPGEAPEAAVLREIREELGCDLVLTRALPRFDHDYGAVVIAMAPLRRPARARQCRAPSA